MGKLCTALMGSLYKEHQNKQIISQYVAQNPCKNDDLLNQQLKISLPTCNQRTERTYQSLEILRQRITTQETCFQKMQTQSGPLLIDMLLKVVQTNVFQIGLDLSTKFQMLNKINFMNHIQCIISQPSINLQQGQHVLCLHKFFVVCQLFDYTLYWSLYIKSVQKAMKTWSSVFQYLYSKQLFKLRVWFQFINFSGKNL